MKQLFAIIGFLVVGLGALGYFRGWYTVSSTETTIDFSLDKTKVQADRDKVQTTTQDAVKELRGEPTSSETTPPAQGVPAPAPPPKK